MIRIYTTGRHAHRSPLSYPALHLLFEQDVMHVAEPADADLYVFAHVSDIQEAPQTLVEDWRRRRRPVLLLSEEPFWDTIWGKQPLEATLYVDTAFGPLPVQQLNHYTSDIFRFDRLPYYLLTNPRFARAYRARFVRNAALDVQDWHAHFTARTVDVTFMFERRPEAYHTVHWPQGDITGLCAWRTEMAEARTSGTVERLGHSWQGGINRLDMDTDWHADKLHHLDDHARIMGAIENTHQPDYVTEKLFDAYACGSLPLYYASVGHRIHDIDLHAHSWINLYDLSPRQAAKRVEDIEWSAHLEGFVQAQNTLATLFCNDMAWHAEHTRLRHATVTALQRFL